MLLQNLVSIAMHTAAGDRQACSHSMQPDEEQAFESTLTSFRPAHCESHGLHQKLHEVVVIQNFSWYGQNLPQS
jgi:hypothetical protein